MASCTFPYIEKTFRAVNPKQANYFNDLSNAVWKELKDSDLFIVRTNNKNVVKMYLNKTNTLKRQKQDALINKINTEKNATIVYSQNDVINVNLTPLFNLNKNLVGFKEGGLLFPAYGEPVTNNDKKTSLYKKIKEQNNNNEDYSNFVYSVIKELQKKRLLTKYQTDEKYKGNNNIVFSIPKILKSIGKETTYNIMASKNETKINNLIEEVQNNNFNFITINDRQDSTEVVIFPFKDLFSEEENMFDMNDVPVIDTENIISYEGSRGAAQYDRSKNIIKINRTLLKQKFQEKAWTKPRKLMETLHGEEIESYAQALPENQFTSYPEWEQFVINHEYQHYLYPRDAFNQDFPEGTKGDYETEINKRALEQYFLESENYLTKYDFDNYVLDLGETLNNQGIQLNLFEPIIEETNPIQEIQTNLIPNSIEEQFIEAKKLENKVPENNEELNKKILYSLILPNVSSERFFKVFSQNDPNEFESYRQEKVKSIINTFAEKFGITIETINEYQKRYGIINNKSISYNGVANLANKTIQYLDGNTEVLTEEVAHFMVAMLSKEGLEYNDLKNYIEFTPEYQLYYKYYLELYNNNEDKAKEEIMGKVLANSLLGNKETVPLSLRSIITRIINFFKQFLNPDYERNFTKSLNNINHLFFTENFDTIFNEANITFDELYNVNFVPGADREVFEKGNKEILANIAINLARTRQVFVENKQTDLVKRVDELIKIIENENPDESNVDKIQNFIELSLIEVKKLNLAFKEFEASGIIEELEKLDFKNLSEEEQILATEEQRLKNLNYIASAITTLQNLNTFITLITENFNNFNIDKETLSDYKKIINTLPNDDDNVRLFKKALSFTDSKETEKEIFELTKIYNDLSRKLLDITFKTLNTKEQTAFLIDLDATNLLPNNSNFKNKLTDINPLQTIKDYFTGKYSKVTSLTDVISTKLTPLNFQSSLILKLIDNANASFRQIQTNADAKSYYEYELLESELQALGVFDSRWLSAKDINGNIANKLLQKYNYKTFKQSLVKKIVNEKLKTIINYRSVLNQTKNNDSKILEKLFEKNYKSTNELKIELLKAFNNTEISNSLYLFLSNYVDGLEKIYTLQLVEPNENLSNVDKSILNTYKNEYISQLKNKLTKLDFSKATLPKLFTNFIFSEDNLSKDQLTNVVNNLIETKKQKLIKEYITVPERINGKISPVYLNQLGYVEGLLNHFKQSINYVQNTDGEVKVNLLNMLIFGEEKFFNLSDKNSTPGIQFIDQDYANIEKDLNSSNPKTKQIAETKLKLIKKTQEDNLKDNNPSNYLPPVPKDNGAQYLTDDVELRKYLDIFLRVLPAAFITSQLAPFAPNILTYSDLIVVPPIFLYSIFGIDKIIKFAYLAKKTKNLKKALSLFSSNEFKTEFRESLIDNTNPEDPQTVAKKLANFFKNLLTSKYLDKFFNKANTNNNIDTNDFLLGEFVVPRPFNNKSYNPAELSTDFISNIKVYRKAMSNYKVNLRWQSWIRMISDYQSTIPGNNYLEIINLIKDKYFFNKMYNPNGLTSTLRIMAGVNAFRVLTGNVKSTLQNINLGLTNLFIHTDPTLFAEGFIRSMKSMSQRFGNNLGISEATDDLVNLFTGNNSNKHRLAFFKSLFNVFLPKNTLEIKNRENVYKHISKNLRRNKGTTYNESQTYFIRALNLTETQALSNVTEKIIENIGQSLYFLSNPLIDENGNPIKNFDNYLKIVDGKIVLDKKQLNIDKIYLKTSLNVKSQDYYENLDINSPVSISRITPKELNLKPLTDLELSIFLNETMLENISQNIDSSQGVFNKYNQSAWRRQALGIALLQYRDHVIPAVKIVYNEEQIDKDLTSLGKGFLNTISKYLGFFISKKYSKTASLEEDKYLFNTDGYQNLLILNNIDNKILWKELNILKNFYQDVKNTNIDTRLKNLASDNYSFRKNIKSKTSISIINDISTILYNNKYGNLSGKDLDNKIIQDFKLNSTSKTFNQQLNLIKNILKTKFEKNEEVSNEDLNTLNQYDINQNFTEIIYNYNKLQNRLSGDIKSLNKLINLTTYIIGSGLLGLLLTLFLSPPEKPEEKKDSIFADLNMIKTIKILIEQLSSDQANIISSYMPLLEPDAYGFNIAKGRYDLKKAAPIIGDMYQIARNIDLSWNTDDAVRSSEEKIYEREDLRDYIKKSNNIYFLKPKLEYNSKTRKWELQNNTDFKESIMKFFINKDVSNKFELYTNEKDQKVYEKIRDFNAIDLYYYKLKSTKFSRFSETPVDIEDQEERDQLIKDLNEERAKKNK